MKRTITAALLVALFSAGTARAGYDLGIDLQVADYPADGATGVPINTILVYGALAPGWPEPGLTTPLEDVVLEGPGGTPVELTWVDDVCYDGWSIALRPLNDLDPDTSYTLYKGSTLIATFTTGATADDEAPDFVPGADDEEDGLAFTFTGSADIVLVATDSLMELGKRCLVRSPDAGSVAFRFDHDNHEWGDDQDVVALDGAGNRSAIITIAMKDAGCTVAGGARAEGFLPLLLGGLALLLRRRRR